jgi:hypothetical protein
MRTRDLITGLATLLVGAAASYDARHLAWFSQSNVPGPGFLPRAMSLLLCVLGVLLCATAVRARSTAPALVTVPAGKEEDGPSEQSYRGLAVLVCFAAGAVLVRYLGFPAAMIAMILVILFLVERRRGVSAVLVALTIPVVAYLLFSHAFAINLPLGPVSG